MKKRVRTRGGRVSVSRESVSLHSRVNARTAAVRRVVRRNRVLLVTFLGVSVVMAALTGISLATGEWANEMHGGVRTLNPPEPRFGFGAAVDPNKQEVLIFGGFVATTPTGAGGIGGPPIETWGDTRIFRRSDSYGNAFYQGRNPLISPSPRGFSAIAYDGARRNAVLFGGGLYRSNTVYGDTWVWANDQWTLKQPLAPTPLPRQNHGMVYDAHRRVVLLFGGRGASGQALNDTWTWDGEKWTEWVLPPDKIPTPRYGHAMAYDVCNAEAVMFGGVGAADSQGVHSAPRETWTWFGNGWRQAFPIAPLGRIGAGMDYSEKTGRVLMYGGLNTNEAGVVSGAIDTDVWRWERSLNAWQKMASEAGTAHTFGAIGDANVTRHAPPPRGFGMFLHDHVAFVGGASFKVFGGTPAPATSQYSPGSDPQYAHGDDYSFHEWAFADLAVERRSTTGGSIGDAQNQPRDAAGVIRECAKPVPLPEGEEIPIQKDEEEPREPVRTGMDEVDAPGDPAKLNEKCIAAGARARENLPVEWPCVLRGTDWPGSQRNTHAFSGNPRPVNPDYTPRPECPGSPGNYGSNPYLITDQKRNRAYQFFVCDPDTGYQNSPAQGTYNATPDKYDLLVQVHDGTTLEVISRIVLGNVNLQDWFHDVDKGRFLMRSSYYSGTSITELLDVRQDLLEKGVNPIVSRTPPGPVSNISMRQNMFNDPKSRRIKLLYRGPSVPAASPQDVPGATIIQYDVEGQEEDWRVVVYLPDCKGGLPGFYSSSLAGPIFRNGDWIYTSCLLSSGNYAVVRVALEEDPSDPISDRPKSAGGNPVTEVYPGYAKGPLQWNDPEAGRVLFGPSYPGSKVWVFDGESAGYVGLVTIGLSSDVQYGFDQETGRLYAHRPDYVQTGYSNSGKEPGGIMQSDTRLTPVPQPLKFTQFSSFPAIPIVILPPSEGASRRIITRRRQGTMATYPDGIPKSFENELFYRVISDDIPIPGETQLAELDKLTLGIPETPGKTEAFYDAQGSGYGIRLRSAGGIWSVLRFSDTSEGEALFYRNDLPLKGLMPNCLYPDRELMAGWVPEARLSSIAATARSSGMEVDSNSKVDLVGPSSRCNPDASPSTVHPQIRSVLEILWPLWQLAQFEVNQAAGSGVAAGAGEESEESITQDTPLGTLEVGLDESGNPNSVHAATTSTAWEDHFKQVECVGDAITRHDAYAGNIYAQARCVKQEGLVEATARGSATGGGGEAIPDTSGVFSTGEGYSEVTIRRDSVKGIVVKAQSVAKAIQVGLLSIDRVETIAEVWSNGRPSEERRASFTRKICGVITPDYQNGRCLTAKEQQDFVTNWNKGWGGRSKMYLPEPDPSFYDGSPGGYISGVIKPLSDAVQDQLISRDAMREVPGLVIVFVKDSANQGPASQSLHLAGVRAVAGLGVQCTSDLMYSPSAGKCVELAFDEDEEEFEEEFVDEEVFEEDFELKGEWTAVEAAATKSESLGVKIGELLDRLPVIRQLPIRQMGEALLLGSVWMLLGLPLFLASRRFARIEWRTN